MGVNITAIDYLRVLIIKIGSTIILMVVEAQGSCSLPQSLPTAGIWGQKIPSKDQRWKGTILRFFGS